MTLFTIFSTESGKVVGETKSQAQANHINKNYQGVMSAKPHNEFRQWVKIQRDNGAFLECVGS